MKIQTLVQSVAAVLLFGLAAMDLAQANPMSANITYFSIDSGDPDANHLCCTGGGVPEVQNNLGPDGLPVLIPGFTSGGHAPHDVNGAGELTYWSPTFDSHVQNTGTFVTSLPFNDGHMYNPDGTGSSDGGTNGFLSAIISATLVAPTAETISFTIASDDNAFVYLDGQLACNDGGVHAASSVSCSTFSDVSAGPHSLLVFYDDLNVTGAVLDFSVDTVGVSTTPAPLPGTSVPEPGSPALIGLALSAMFILNCRGRKVTAARSRR